jgi:hypothetical protein
LFEAPSALPVAAGTADTADPTIRIPIPTARPVRLTQLRLDTLSSH